MFIQFTVSYSSDRQNKLDATDIVLNDVENFCIMFIVFKLIFIKVLYVPEIL